MREYRYRTLFAATHEQYLDEPTEVIDWMLHIDNEHKRAESKHGD